MASIISASTTSATALNMSADTTGVLQFATGATPTTAVTIDTSQNVGIGTTSPANFLDISKTQNAETNIGLSNTSTGADAQVRTKYTTNSGLFTVGTTGTAHPYGGDAYIYQVANKGIRFATNDTERMRIDSSGKVGIGMSPTDPLTIQCSSQTFGGGLGFKLSGGANNWGVVVGGDAKLYLGYSATTTPSAVGNFATNGTYTATSDIRKKKDVTYIFNGLEIVNALKPAQGRMLEDEDTSPLRPMFIAQDMVDVIPALVSNLEPEPSDDPLLGVDYASITPVLVKAIQEQQTIINDLKARIETLEAK